MDPSFFRPSLPLFLSFSLSLTGSLPSSLYLSSPFFGTLSFSSLRCYVCFRARTRERDLISGGEKEWKEKHWVEGGSSSRWKCNESQWRENEVCLVFSFWSSLPSVLSSWRVFFSLSLSLWGFLSHNFFLLFFSHFVWPSFQLDSSPHVVMNRRKELTFFSSYSSSTFFFLRFLFKNNLLPFLAWKEELYLTGTGSCH